MKRAIPIAVMLLACASEVEPPSIDGVGGSVGATGGASAASSAGSGGAQSVASSGPAGGAGGTGGSADGGGEAGVGGSVEAGVGGEAPVGGAGGGGGGDVRPGPAIILSDLDRPNRLVCAGARIYWVALTSGDVRSASLDGADVRLVAKGAAVNASAAKTNGADILYSVPGSPAKIVRVPTSGGEPSTLVEYGSINGFSIHDGELYWHDQHDIVSGSGVVHTSRFAIKEMDLDGSGIYFSDEGGVRVVPLLGGLERTLTSEDASSGVLRLDGDYVYFTTPSALMRIQKGLGIAETVIDHDVRYFDMTASAMAWIGAEVYTKVGDADARAIATYHGAGSLVICDGYVFWSSSDGYIARAAL